MKIYSMTATFGKLAHETLTLKPGLNVIQAPNEWGKSTWCAFLAAMLYGLDTRAKSTKSALAEKEHYAPWSGAPMEGRMEICWNGRDITIERSTRGRIPMGDFRAYETRSGLDVPELNARNCGQMLLGVEKSVFLRSGFIRFGDIPVSQDDALRARLNALVTTGDESGAGEKLAKNLKELKNRCRYHKTGLLPQAEAERDELEEQIEQIGQLENTIRNLEKQQAQTREWISRLENHSAYLAYEEALADAARVDRAAEEYREAECRLRELTQRRENVPEKKNPPLKWGGILLFMAILLAGILLGVFWNATAGILMAVWGLAGILWLGIRKPKDTAGDETYPILLAQARQNVQARREHYEALRAMASTLPGPVQPAGLTMGTQETARALREAREEQIRLESRRAQYLGRMESLGDRKTLETCLSKVNARIQKLEETYCALTLAQETLAEASAQLQRRFAPQITEGAARRMETMTQGRYHRVLLNEDLELLAAAEGEGTLREANWRSSGTMDQLYLSLRLAVAEAVAPDAPLILDDALVRFDDERLAAAVKLLQAEARTRQVILFSCQSREKQFADL